MMEKENVSLRVPTPLRPYTGKQSSVGLTGSTVAEALAALVEQYPALRRHLLDEHGMLRSFVNLYLNGEDIHDLNGIETALAPGDKLAIVPAIAGGWQRTPV